MAFGGVAAPVDDEIGSVLDLAQRAGNLAAQLGGYLGGTVSERSVAIDHPSDEFRKKSRFPLGLARDIA
jgi:hypothetical protein